MARYIDADVAKEILSSHEDNKGYLVGDFEQIIDEEVPTADVRKNVHAHWDKVEVKSGEWWHTCSKCKATWGSEDGELDFNFCPNCGAQMDERRTDDDND